MNNLQNWNNRLFIDRNVNFNFKCLNNKEKQINIYSIEY